MRNIFRTVRIAVVGTAVLLVGAGATITSAAATADHHSIPATVTLAGADEPLCIGCWD